jgi:hypothetical protein
VAIDLRTAVRQTWERALDEQETVIVRDVVARVRDDFPDVVESEGERLIDTAIAREVKSIARTEAEQGAQLTLFGFPSVIAIPIPDDGYEYMQAVKARWEQLAAGGQIREDNVRRAQLRLDAYNGALDHVRPVMEGTERTLSDALALLSDEANA